MNLPTQTFRDVFTQLDFIRDWFRNDAQTATRGSRRGRNSMGTGNVPTSAVHQHAKDHSTDSEDDDDPSISTHNSAAFLPRVYLLVHNIDGASLRNEIQQQALAQLASIPQIHLVASVDHILSGWLWDEALLNQFNFIHHDCTTYAAYEREFLYAAGSSVTNRNELVDSSQSGRASGIANVLSSLTPNHRKVLDVLAREQLQPNNPNFLPQTNFLLRSAFLSACEDNMLVSNEAAFDRLMTELKDHNLIEEKVVQKSRVVHIPYAANIIRRHILGETDETTAAADDELNANVEDDNPFAQAIGASQADEEELPDEVDEE